MTDRSAVDTITGYHYQFDHSIHAVLSLPNDDDSIDIEVIEDIDINLPTGKTAIQCKYYSKTEYNHSVIKDAVMFMLTHFKEAKDGTHNKIQYKLYGHYKSGQDKLKLPMSIDFLKNEFLTKDSYTTDKTTNKKTKITYHHHDNLGLNNNDLQEFIGLLHIDINAKDISSQQDEIIKKLASIFKCTLVIAEYLHYSNALALIRRLSINQTASGRRITKKEFLKTINTSNLIFNDLLIWKKGKDQFYKSLRSAYFSQLNLSSNERFFLIESSSDIHLTDLKSLLIKINNKYSKVKSEPRPFFPYIFINGLQDHELLTLKNELHNDGFSIHDGHDYLGASYNPKSLAQKVATRHDKKELKIINASPQINPTLMAISGRTREVYQFYIGSAYFDIESPLEASVRHIKIQVEAPLDILKII